MPDLKWSIKLFKATRGGLAASAVLILGLASLVLLARSCAEEYESQGIRGKLIEIWCGKEAVDFECTKEK